jgi:hypothetical protein
LLCSSQKKKQKNKTNKNKDFTSSESENHFRLAFDNIFGQQENNSAQLACHRKTIPEEEEE